MMTEKSTLFLLAKLWSSFYPLVPVPVLRAPVSGSGFISKKDPLFIPYVLGTFHPKLGFWGGRCVVGPFPVLRPLSLPPSPVKSLANKKRARLGPFFAVLICFKRSFLRFVPLSLGPFGRLCWPFLRLVPGLRSRFRTNKAALLKLCRFRVPPRLHIAP